MTMDESDQMNQSLDMVTSSTIIKSSGEDESGYCTHAFQVRFVTVFGVVSTVTCCIGILTNILIMLVLTRKNMSRSPTNAIVTSIALADFLFLISILIFKLADYNFIDVDICAFLSYSIQLLQLITIFCAFITSRVSVMLTLLLAVWRYIAVTYPLKAQVWCNLRRTIVAIVACNAFVPISMILVFLMLKIDSVNNTTNPSNNSSYCSQTYRIQATQLFVNLDNLVLYAAVIRIVYNVLYKVILPFVVVIITIILIRALYLSSHRRSALTQNSTRLDRSCQRTTKTLLAVLIFFAITELPFGIVITFSPFQRTDFTPSCYNKFFNVYQLVEILNSSVNFVFYITMNKQFRETFRSLSRICSIDRVECSNIFC